MTGLTGDSKSVTEAVASHLLVCKLNLSGLSKKALLVVGLKLKIG